MNCIWTTVSLTGLSKQCAWGQPPALSTLRGSLFRESERPSFSEKSFPTCMALQGPCRVAAYKMNSLPLILPLGDSDGFTISPSLLWFKIFPSELLVFNGATLSSPGLPAL